MDLKYFFVIIYVIIDIVYITVSAPFYSKTVENIQGTPIVLKPSSYVSLVLAYVILGIGWLFIVANRLDAKSTYRDAVFVAFMYAITVYGVFNTTLYVLFDKWDIVTALRDTTWGLVCIISLTLVYYVFLTRNTITV
jgi:uncharacterized membrane protein